MTVKGGVCYPVLKTTGTVMPTPKLPRAQKVEVGITEEVFQQRIKRLRFLYGRNIPKGDVRKLESLRALSSTAVPGTLQETAFVPSQSIEEAVKKYTESFEYATDLKNVQMGKSPKKFPVGDIKQSIATLDKGYADSDKFVGEVFRGMDLEGSAKKKLWTKVGNEIEFDSWSSFTTEKDVAEGYGNTVFRLKTKNGLDISNLSKVKEGGEVLLPRGNKVKVVKTSQYKSDSSSTGKVTLIDLEEIGDTILADDPKWIRKLKPQEKKVIQKWTENWDDMRSADLLGLPNKDLQTFKTALANAPRTRQELHRSIVLDPKQADALSKGKYFDNLATSSYTDSEATANTFLAGKVRDGKSFIRIKGQMEGVNISQLSAHSNIPEFIVDKGTRLQIKGRKEVTVEGIKGWEVEVEEAPAPKRFTDQKAWEASVKNTKVGETIKDYSVRSQEIAAFQRGQFKKAGVKASKEHQQEALEEIKIQTDTLQNAYDTAPLYEGKIFRTMALDGKTRQLWTTPGNEFEFDAWQSFTSEQKVADRIVELKKPGTGVVFSLETKKGFNIGNLVEEEFKWQKEILLPKGSKVRVKSVKGNQVVLEELEVEHTVKKSAVILATQDFNAISKMTKSEIKNKIIELGIADPMGIDPTGEIKALRKVLKEK